jgi:hypothetical protein
MSTQKQVQSLAEQCWRTLLTDGRKPLRVVQVLFRVLPAPPRCKKCYAPYRGVGRIYSARDGEFPNYPAADERMLIGPQWSGIMLIVLVPGLELSKLPKLKRTVCRSRLDLNRGARSGAP